MWPACQQSRDEIAGGQCGEQYEILWFEPTGFGAAVKSLMPIEFAGLHGMAALSIRV
jgi:hypothetical protein